MTLQITSVKIMNILNYFGSHLVNLHPITVIVCNFSNGKDAFIKALNFGLGASIESLGFFRCSELRNERCNLSCPCGIELKIRTGSLNLTLTRCIQNESVLNYINDEEVSSEHYMRVLKNFHTNDQTVLKKNFFANEDIWDVLSDKQLEFDLDQFIMSSLGREYLGGKIAELKKEMKFLKTSQSTLLEKHYLHVEKSTQRVLNAIKKYTHIYQKYDKAREQKMLNGIQLGEISHLQDHDDTPPFLDEEQLIIHEMQNEVDKIEEKINGEENDLNQRIVTYSQKVFLLTLKKKSSTRLIELVGNIEIMLRNYERKITNIKLESEVLSAKAKHFSEEYVHYRVELDELNFINSLKLRISSYGRFIDFVNPKGYEELFQLVFDKLLYANIVKSFMDAVQHKEHNERQTYLILDNCHNHFLDFLISLKAKPFERLLDVQLFLGKMLNMKIIDQAPITLTEGSLLDDNFDFNSKRTIMFLKTREFFLPNAFGIIESPNVSNIGEMSTEILKSKINNAVKCQEFSHEMHRIMQHQKDVHLPNMQDLAKILVDCRQNLETPSEIDRSTHYKHSLPPKIYDEYEEFFANVEEHSFTTEPMILESWEEDLEEELITLYQEINELEEQLRQQYSQLSTCMEYICQKDITLEENFDFSTPVQSVHPKNLELLSWESQLNKLKEVINRDDIESFDWSQSHVEFRNAIRGHIEDHLQEISSSIHSIKMELKALHENRNSFYSNYLAFVNKYLVNHLEGILGPVFQDYTLKIKREEVLAELTINNEISQTISQHNQFVKFSAILSLILVNCGFNEVPLLILDDMGLFQPCFNDDLDACLLHNVWCTTSGQNGMTVFNGFLAKSRVAQYFNFLVKKNQTAGTDERTGPQQIISFVTSPSNVYQTMAIVPEVCGTNGRTLVSQLIELTK